MGNLTVKQYPHTFRYTLTLFIKVHTCRSCLARCMVSCTTLYCALSSAAALGAAHQGRNSRIQDVRRLHPEDGIDISWSYCWTPSPTRPPSQLYPSLLSLPLPPPPPYLSAASRSVLNRLRSSPTKDSCIWAMDRSRVK